MGERKSGILCHISSLPSEFGIGDLGPEAYKFVDFLHESKQKIWQILPLTPTNILTDNSPYSSPSAFAGNSLFISPGLLLEEGLIHENDLKRSPKFSEDRVDYKKVIEFKSKLLKKAVERFDIQDLNYQSFVEENKYWLDDYALFTVLKSMFGKKFWNKWPGEFRTRDNSTLFKFSEDNPEVLNGLKITQFIFFKQWSRLKKYCYQKSVEVLGDIPIYVHFDSADVWRYPQNYKLDKNFRPTAVAGAPPDAFSDEGQRWGNPVYDWAQLKEDNFDWWLKRFHFNRHLYDWIRVDHFRGFISYWEIPYKEKTAQKGRWVEAPYEAFFDSLNGVEGDVPIIAEDLGDISNEVRDKIKSLGFPGMKVLQFAFENDMTHNPYLPHNYEEDCVVYTGTHDNNTTAGWLSCLNEIEDNHVCRYLELDKGSVREYKPEIVSWRLIGLAIKSKANWCIFPLQDILSLDEKERMNIPGVKKGNWRWRFTFDRLTDSIRAKLADLSKAYQRI